MAHLRNLALTLVQGSLRLVLGTLSRVVPTTRQVVVSGFPETEGNAVEAARALLGRYPGTVVWLTESPAPTAEVKALVEQGLVLVPKASLAGLVAYLRAEAVFFTHGLYGSPRPSRRKPLVNLWHGDGPKATRPGSGAGSLIPSTYLVASTEIFGRLKAEAFEVPGDRLLVTGNPRTDQLWRAPGDDPVAGLGITGEFVLWMPTFRSTRAIGAVKTWSESTGPSDDVATLRPLLDGLRDRGIQLVVKPHPLDAESRDVPGAVVVTDEALVDAGVSLYSLLGQARGLVTDYSSVWVDFLLLDRPLAFHVPDEETYTRALAPADVLAWLPGERVTGTGEPFAAFLADLDARGRLGAGTREQVADKLGLQRTRSSADDLVSALVARGVLRG